MIVVDASLALKIVLLEADSARARQVWSTWVNEGEILIAPPPFRIEIASAIRKSVYRGTISEADGNLAYEQLGKFSIDVREPKHLIHEAWALAKKFNRPTVYDCCYLALASIVGCDMWTADKRLANAVTPQLPWVRTFS